MNTTQSNSLVEPYLFFDGRCEEAIEFYRRALGAEVNMLMRYKDSPEPPRPAPPCLPVPKTASCTPVCASVKRC